MFVKDCAQLQLNCCTGMQIMLLTVVEWNKRLDFDWS